MATRRGPRTWDDEDPDHTIEPECRRTTRFRQQVPRSNWRVAVMVSKAQRLPKSLGTPTNNRRKPEMGSERNDGTEPASGYRLEVEIVNDPGRQAANPATDGSDQAGREIRTPLDKV